MNELIDALAPVVATIIPALAAWALTEAARYIRKKTGNEAINNALAHVIATTQATVAEISQVAGDTIRANAGRIDERTGRKLKEQAVDLVLSRLTPEVLAAAKKGTADLTDYLHAQVERAVREQKMLRPVALESAVSGKE